MRITKKQIEYQVKMLNEDMGNKTKSYENGKSNIGTYTIDYSYGGCKLHQIVNNGGGVVEITPYRLTKRELYYVVNGMNNLTRYKEKNKNNILYENRLDYHKGIHSKDCHCNKCKKNNDNE